MRLARVIFNDPADGPAMSALNRATNTANVGSNLLWSIHKVVPMIGNALGGTIIDLDGKRIGVVPRVACVVAR